MHPANNAQSTAESHAEELSGSDPYLISAVKNCHAADKPAVSENMAIVCDELDTTASRRLAALVQLQGKNLTGNQ